MKDGSGEGVTAVYRAPAMCRYFYPTLVPMMNKSSTEVMWLNIPRRQTGHLTKRPKDLGGHDRIKMTIFATDSVSEGEFT
jgi:hypothetical protein